MPYKPKGSMAKVRLLARQLTTGNKAADHDTVVEIMRTQEQIELAQAAVSRSVSIALRAYRVAHGLTQEQLADLLGVSRVTVARTECGNRPPTKKLLKALDTLGSAS